MKKIKLTRGKYALVDDTNFKWLNQWKWCAIKKRNIWYATHGDNPKIYMHRLILGLKYGDGKIVDHINHNGLNNQRQNIRICTHAENLHNRKNAKGYSWHKGAKKWQATIQINYKSIHLGYFKTKKEATGAYAKAKHEMVKEVKDES